MTKENGLREPKRADKRHSCVRQQYVRSAIAEPVDIDLEDEQSIDIAMKLIPGRDLKRSSLELAGAIVAIRQDDPPRSDDEIAERSPDRINSGGSAHPKGGHQ
jgi:hypothetical protein